MGPGSHLPVSVSRFAPGRFLSTPITGVLRGRANQSRLLESKPGHWISRGMGKSWAFGASVMAKQEFGKRLYRRDVKNRLWQLILITAVCRFGRQTASEPLTLALKILR